MNELACMGRCAPSGSATSVTSSSPLWKLRGRGEGQEGRSKVGL